jgi:putative transposase
MTVSKHNEGQIIAALKQVEAGRKAEDVAREYGVSKHTIYAWKAWMPVTPNGCGNWKVRTRG